MSVTSYRLAHIKPFLNRTAGDVFSDEVGFRAEFAVTEQPVPWSERLSLNYKPVILGQKWGQSWQSAWFHLTIDVPEHLAEKELAIHADFGGEALLFDQEGTPLWSFTDHSVFAPRYVKNYYILPGTFKAGEKLDLWFDVVASSLFGINQKYEEFSHRPPNATQDTATYLNLAHFNRQVRDFRLAFEVLNLQMEFYTEKDYRFHRILRVLEKAVDAYGYDKENVVKAMEILEPALSLGASSTAMTVCGVGHAHIDVGWLWPVRESIRKAARTFSSQLRLMEQYPDYIFGASQPQLYEFVQDNYPQLFEEIKERVAEGRWELQGGMWVECDCNIPSGESLIRQFMYGKNYFMKNFGRDVRNIWIPDVFGYPGALPQIAVGCGCDALVTQKISWNAVNVFPYHTFRWRGIDGTEIASHFPPEDNYCCSVLPDSLSIAQNKVAADDDTGEFLCLYGIGDGGGGPSYEHVERGLLCQDLDGVPKFSMRPAQTFLDKIQGRQAELPLWVGELYLEMHRGTLTTQSKVKRFNRKLEQLLTAAEYLLSFLPQKQESKEILDYCWKKLLLNQFHDIIPGSSIKLVYDVALQEYAEIQEKLKKLICQTGEQLFAQDTEKLTLVNTLPIAYQRPLEMPNGWAPAGCPVQREKDGRVFAAIAVPADSTAVLTQSKGQLPETQLDHELVLENDYMRCVFADDARLLSMVTKSDKREWCSEAGNVLRLYLDRSNFYDAWDVEIDYRRCELEDAVATAVPVRESGAVRQVIHFQLRIGKSLIKQDISLSTNGRCLEFATTVQWDEEGHRMLRTAFPVDVHTVNATYDIQYGYIQRPTHTNTSWEQAKFENCGQRYADLTDGNGGVALLNDCKYGYYVRENILDLALLRSPRFPDETADMGTHCFTYAIMPHQEQLTESQVMDIGAQLNRKPLLFPQLRGELLAPLSVTGASLEILKHSESGDCLVARLLENKGRTSQVTIKTSLLPQLTNLIEWEDGEELLPLPGTTDTYQLQLHPFQLQTLKLRQKP